MKNIEQNIEQNIADFLLQSKAIKLEPKSPFTWASGWKSPIYCDNRITLSFPSIRNYIKNSFIEVIGNHFPDAEVIAGVATGAIAQGAMVADGMDLPFVYVRSAAKSHGMENLIEGTFEPGSKIVVVEDLVSTGGSSLKAVDALRNKGAEVMGMVAIFTYGFAQAEESFKEKQCRLITLSNYDALLKQAVEADFIKKNDMELLNRWRKDPENWLK